MKLAVDIKRNFPDLQVFDRDDMAFVKVVMYKDDAELMEVRVEQKDSDSAFVEASREYWITCRVVSIPDLPELPKVINEGTEVVTTKIDLYKKIDEFLRYARAL
jgi:hypothetical protein